MIVQKIKNRLTYLKNKKNIRKYDKSVDHRSWNGADFYENYFTPFQIAEPNGPFNYGAYRELKIDNQTGSFAASLITDFKEKIVGFLGDRTRLDDIYMFWYDPGKRDNWSYSNSWHDDNVGHRIKIYACFEGNGSTPTVVLPSSYNKPYSIRRRQERARVSGIRDTDGRSGEIRLAYKVGDVAIFDTSCLHRGLYEEPAARRAVLVLEFINRDKCNAIAGILPCAPGMSPSGKILFETRAYEALKQTGLLDESLIAREGDDYCYSLANYDRERGR